MEEKVSLIKRFDLFVFTKIDEFRKTPNYSKLVNLYGQLEDEQQKVAKIALLAATFILPFLMVVAMFIGNMTVESDLANRTALVERMQQIIAQNGDIGGLANSLASPTPLNNEGELNGRISSALSSAGVDLSKMRISNFSTNNISPTLSKAEADFKFTGLTTEQLMNIFSTLLQRERFRIASVQIKRNDQTNVLEGQFHGVHYGEIQTQDEE
ncbi:MAG: hypothetical protein K2P81_13985 [Bacteriovoracaceae bacterium]|nr:hypothetical protein [Bacteriovoracaceae bacterium]